MKKELICASIVTEKSYKEFLLLERTIGLFYNVTWYLSVDDYAYKRLSPEHNAINIITTDKGTHSNNNAEDNDIWMKIMMTKFSICELALEHHSYVLFLDCDIFFVNKFSDEIYNLVTKNNDIDAILSPHHTENKQLEAGVGHYNGGMFCIKSKEMLSKWKYLSSNYKKTGMYYEQQPLEYSCKEYITCNFPIQYNIGWWRMNEVNTKSRLNTIAINPLDNELYFIGLKAINFHVHTFKEIGYKNVGEPMLNHVLAYLKLSKNINHKKIVDIFANLVTLVV